MKTIKLVLSAIALLIATPASAHDERVPLPGRSLSYQPVVVVSGLITDDSGQKIRAFSVHNRAEDATDLEVVTTVATKIDEHERDLPIAVIFEKGQPDRSIVEFMWLMLERLDFEPHTVAIEGTHAKSIEGPGASR